MDNTFEREVSLWSQGRTSPDALAWARELSDTQRLEALTTLPRVGWTDEEQAKFASIWTVIDDQGELSFGTRGARESGGERFSTDRRLTTALLEALAMAPEQLHNELEILVARYRAEEAFSETDKTRLGIYWAALTVRENTAGVGWQRSGASLQQAS